MRSAKPPKSAEPEFETRTVTLKEMVEAMKTYRDDEVFRWYQVSYIGPDGTTQPGVTLRVTMGQARKELLGE